jgi:hypothetical protein
MESGYSVSKLPSERPATAPIKILSSHLDFRLTRENLIKLKRDIRTINSKTIKDDGMLQGTKSISMATILFLIVSLFFCSALAEDHPILISGHGEWYYTLMGKNFTNGDLLEATFTCQMPFNITIINQNKLSMSGTGLYIIKDEHNVSSLKFQWTRNESQLYELYIENPNADNITINLHIEKIGTGDAIPTIPASNTADICLGESIIGNIVLCFVILMLVIMFTRKKRMHQIPQYQNYPIPPYPSPPQQHNSTENEPSPLQKVDPSDQNSGIFYPPNR